MTSMNESFFAQFVAMAPPENGASEYNRIEGKPHETRAERADEELAAAGFPVPLYVIAAAALLG